jgi:hypothetical protein
MQKKDTVWRVTKEDGDRRHFESFRGASSFAKANPGAIVEEVDREDAVAIEVKYGEET